MTMLKPLVAAATAAVLLSGCVSTVVPAAGPVESLLISRIQGAVNEYCKKSDELRLAYRIIVAEVTTPHVVRIDCAKASVVDPPT